MRPKKIYYLAGRYYWVCDCGQTLVNKKVGGCITYKGALVSYEYHFENTQCNTFRVRLAKAIQNVS